MVRDYGGSWLMQRVLSNHSCARPRQRLLSGSLSSAPLTQTRPLQLDVVLV